ncbi:hypothetical protein ACHAWX_005537 [Stephanocyclus meneghinianus]
MAVCRTIHLLKASNNAVQPMLVAKNIPCVWQRNVSRFFDSDILPQNLGGKSENVHLAWYGDKVLGVHVAESVRKLFGSSLHRGVASEIYSKAVSNSFMSEHVEILLPILSKAQDLQPKLTNETVGTIIETAVARMKMNGKIDAIDDLSEWLRTEALIAEIQEKQKLRSEILLNKN